MNPITDEKLFDENLGRYPYTFSLGVKEFLFLSMIFFFGFCGFSVCVEKIYAQKSNKSIENITIHDIEITHLDLYNAKNIGNRIVIN